MDSCCYTDVALVGMNNEEVATRLRGRAGTSVTLKVRRAVNVSVLHQFPCIFLYECRKIECPKFLCLGIVDCIDNCEINFESRRIESCLDLIQT